LITKPPGRVQIATISISGGLVLGLRAREEYVYCRAGKTHKGENGSEEHLSALVEEKQR
jgi:hypothetical protein